MRREKGREGNDALYDSIIYNPEYESDLRTTPPYTPIP
jgi:hypothetical protein